MKKITTYLISMVFVLITSPVWAGSVTIPNTFSSGTKAVAADVNDNFSAVKSAVDDNDTRITDNAANVTSNTTNKQNRVAGACGAGYAIRSVNADGSVVCQADTNSGGDITDVTAGPGLTGGGTSGSVAVKLASGAVSVSSSQMQPADYRCIGQRDGIDFYWPSSNTYSACRAVAGVNLPQDATLTGLKCRLYDNDISGSSYVTLNVIELYPYTLNTTLYTTPSTVDKSISQMVETTTSSTTIHVDNYTHAYSLTWHSSAHDTSVVSTYARFSGCRISYTY